MNKEKVMKNIEKHLKDARQYAKAGELTDYRWDRTHNIHVSIEEAGDLAKAHNIDIEDRVQEITNIAYAKAFPTSLRKAKKAAWQGDLAMVNRWKWAIGKYAETIGQEFP